MILASIFESGVSIQFYIVLSTILFAIGVLGVLVRKNAIIVLMCIEIMRVVAIVKNLFVDGFMIITLTK